MAEITSTEDAQARLAELAPAGVVTSVADVDPFDLCDDDETIVIAAQLMKIGDAESFASGGTMLVGIKRMIRAVTAHYGRYLDPLNALRAEVLDMKKADLGPLEQAKENLEPQIAAFDRAQKLAAEQERQRRQEEEDRIAREEREAQAAAVERVAAVAEVPGSQKALLREAAAIRNMPVAAAKVAAPPIAKVPGLSSRTVYRAEIVDPLLVIRCIVAGKIPITAIEPERLKESHPALDALAQAMGPALGQLCPGIKVVEKPIVTGR